MSIQCPFCLDSPSPNKGWILNSVAAGELAGYKPCPHCEDGVIALAVEEDCPFYLGICVDGCPEHHEVRCNHNACITRPLTDEEMDFVVHRYAAQPSMSAKEFQERKDAKARDRILAIERGIVTLRGLPVVIQKGE